MQAYAMPCHSFLTDNTHAEEGQSPQRLAAWHAVAFSTMLMILQISMIG